MINSEKSSFSLFLYKSLKTECSMAIRMTSSYFIHHFKIKCKPKNINVSTEIPTRLPHSRHPDSFPSRVYCILYNVHTLYTIYDKVLTISTWLINRRLFSLLLFVTCLSLSFFTECFNERATTPKWMYRFGFGCVVVWYSWHGFSK